MKSFLKFNPIKLVATLIAVIGFFIFEVPFYFSFNLTMWISLIIFVLTSTSLLYFFSIVVIFKAMSDMSIFNNHAYTNYLINRTKSKKTKIPLYNQFFTVTFEEVVFRYFTYYIFTSRYIFPGEIGQLDIPYLIFSSAIFGLYHFHIYVSTKDRTLTAIFILLSFILGLILSVSYLYFGVFSSIFIHFYSVHLIYQKIAKNNR